MFEHTSAYVCLLVSEFTLSTFELHANSAVCVSVCVCVCECVCVCVEQEGASNELCGRG